MDNLQVGEQFKVVNTASDGLILRTDATTKATTKKGEKNKILSIPNGANVTLEKVEVETSDNHIWYRVKYTDKNNKDETGWVASDYLEELPPRSLPTLSISKLWANHPGRGSHPCDEKAFPNQCAIRMGVALEKSGVDLSFFQGLRCSGNFKPPHIAGQHILRAQELADWLRKRTKLVGQVKISKPLPMDAYKGKRGIVFFQNVTGLEGIDHIDVWDEANLRNGCKLYDRYNNWVTMCEHIWFWDLCPCTSTTMKRVIVYSEADTTSQVLFDRDPNWHVEVVSTWQDRKWEKVKIDGKVGFAEYGSLHVLMYSKADVGSEVLHELAPNKHLEVVAVEEKWVQVKEVTGEDFNVDFELGWIQREFVSGIPDQAVAA